MFCALVVWYTCNFDIALIERAVHRFPVVEGLSTAFFSLGMGLSASLNLKTLS